MSFSLGMALLLSASPVSVEGNSSCPYPSAVLARLSAVLPDGDQNPPRRADLARVDSAGDQISITLRSPEGVLIGQRTLPATGSCEERARAVAVVLGTWESDVHPAFKQKAPHAPAAPTAANAPAAASRAQLSPPPSRVTPVDRPVAEIGVSAAPQGNPPAAPTWDLGAGVVGSLADSQLTPGLRVVATATPLARGGARLALEGDRDRSIATGPGEGRWSRWFASLGPQYRVRWGRSLLEGHLSVAAALFQVRGQAFPVSYQTHGFDAGASAGLRLLLPGTRWRLWVALDGTRWLGRRTVRELVSGQERQLASWTASLSVGVSIFRP